MQRSILCLLVIGISLTVAACTRDGTAPDNSTASATTLSWLTNADAAFAAADADDKLVLMDFTGSDWCPPCEVLEAEVFSSAAFAELVDEKFVLLTLDFPRRKTLSEELQQQNAAMAERYEIQAFPTIVVADSEGNELGRTEGYMPGQPDAWLAQIAALTVK